MKILFRDSSPQVVHALAQAFVNEPLVDCSHGDLFALRCDAILSPANSFGDMGGGIDAAIDRHFKRAAQPAVVAAIRERYLGELPVGAAIVLPLRSSRFSYLVVAPTMRVPGNVSHSLNAYLAFRAALVAINNFNRGSPESIASLASPGLCTGVGGMAPRHSASQVFAAFRSIVREQWRDVAYPAMAPFALNDYIDEENT